MARLHTTTGHLVRFDSSCWRLTPSAAPVAAGCQLGMDRSKPPHSCLLAHKPRSKRYCRMRYGPQEHGSSSPTPTTSCCDPVWRRLSPLVGYIGSWVGMGLS